MCVMEEGTMLMLEWWSMKENGLKESVGDEECGIIEKEE